MFIIKITLFYIREEILEVRLDFSCAERIPWDFQNISE